MFNYFWNYKDSFFLLELTENPNLLSNSENNDSTWIDEFLDLPNLETNLSLWVIFFFNQIWFEDY